MKKTNQIEVNNNIRYDQVVCERALNQMRTARIVGHELTRERERANERKKVHETRNSIGMLKFISPFNFVQHTHFVVQLIFFIGHQRFGLLVEHNVCRPIGNNMLPSQMISCVWAPMTMSIKISTYAAFYPSSSYFCAAVAARHCLLLDINRS